MSSCLKIVLEMKTNRYLYLNNERKRTTKRLDGVRLADPKSDKRSIQFVGYVVDA